MAGLDDICTKFETLLSSLEEFQDFFTQQTSNNNENAVQFAAKCDKIEAHEALWEHLLKTFKDKEELKNLIVQKVNKHGNNFIHFVVIYSNLDTIEFTFKKIKEIFSTAAYREILMSKGQVERNLLQIAACSSKCIKAQQFLWKILKISCSSEKEFLEFLTAVDIYSDNVFQNAAASVTGEIFEFMVEELTCSAKNDEIRKILSSLGLTKRNLLQTAAAQNNHLDLHQILWKIIRNHFNSSEILDMIRHANNYGDNLLQIAAGNGTIEVLEVTWNEIRASMDGNGLLEYLKSVNNYGHNILHALVQGKDDKKMDIFWNELEKFFLSENSTQQFRELFSQQTSKNNENVLQFAVKCVKIEVHEVLWKLLLKTFENLQELKDLIIQKYINGYNFVHFLVIYSTPEIIGLTFEKLQKIFSSAEYRKILISKGNFDRNLLQIAACDSTDVKTHQLLWKIFQNSISDQKFMEVLGQVDKNSNNVFYLAAAFSTSQVFEFMVNELRRITTNEDVKKILKSFGNRNGTLLHGSTWFNKSVKIHVKIWEIMQKFLNSSEIHKLITYCDENGQNIFHNVVYRNTKEIVELTWEKIQIFIDKKDYQIEYLMKKGYNGQNLLELSLGNKAFDLEVHLWVKNLMREYEIQF